MAMKNKNAGKIKKIIRRVILWGVPLFFFLLLFFPGVFRGILYPAVDFAVDSSVVEDIYAAGSTPRPMLAWTFWGDFRGSTFTDESCLHILAQKPRQQLYIKKMAYSWEGGCGVFVQDVRYNIPKKAWEFYEDNGGYIFTTRSHIVEEMKIAPEINFGKIFKGKKAGDEFDFRIIVTYSFDDEPVVTQIVNYEVRAFQGERQYFPHLAP